MADFERICGNCKKFLPFDEEGQADGRKLAEGSTKFIENEMMPTLKESGSITFVTWALNFLKQHNGDAVYGVRSCVDYCSKTQSWAHCIHPELFEPKS